MAAIHIEIVSVAPPYQAALIKVDRFPVAHDPPKIRALMTKIVQAAATNGFSSDVFLQAESLKNGKDQFDSHVSEWHPESGLGVWPDRPPPELWKMSDLFRMARGERVPLMYNVYRLNGGPKANNQAFDMLLGSGMVMALVHNGSADELLARYKEEFLPASKQPNLRIMPFYVPLLDHNSLEKRQSAELQKWLGGARLYMRESTGDNAILVLTDFDLGALLSAAGAKKQGDRWILE